MSHLESKRVVIINKGRGPKYESKFFIEIQEAILKGYRIAETNDRADVSMRNFKGSMGRAVLYKAGDVVKSKGPEKGESPSESPLETLKVLNKKSELIDFAKGLGIVIDEEVTAPQKIKKIIRDSLKK